jgi:hypothetical protein
MTNQTKSGGSEVQGSEASMTTRRDSTPTLFADGLLGGSIESGVVRLELVARHLDADSKSLSAALVGRLLMPADKFPTFVAALVELVKKTEAAKSASK